MSFSEAFTKARNSREHNERQNKLAKLQGQVFELEIQGMQAKQNATQDLTDFASGTTRTPAP